MKTIKAILAFYFCGPFIKEFRISVEQWLGVWFITLCMAGIGYAIGSFIYKVFSCANLAMDTYLGK